MLSPEKQLLKNRLSFEWPGQVSFRPESPIQ